MRGVINVWWLARRYLNEVEGGGEARRRLDLRRRWRERDGGSNGVPRRVLSRWLTGVASLVWDGCTVVVGVRGHELDWPTTKE